MTRRDRRKIWAAQAILVRRTSAIYPLLWLNAIVLPASAVAAYFLRCDSVLRYGMLFLVALIELVTIAAYFFFLFRDPDRLHSVS
jgi:hypothetical protein